MALSQRQLAKLREKYLLKREEILQGRVNSLAAKLFDKIFTEYLAQLEQSNGRLVNNGKNISLVNGLDAIYERFNKSENIPVIKDFVTELQGITPLNEAYFNPIAKNKSLNDISKQALKVVNKSIGVTENGKVIPDGFAAKVINDKTVIQAIKKETLKAITQKQGFQQFKNSLKQSIEGTTGQPLSGKVQQYYRNFAYDTFHQVDRMNAEVFAHNLDLHKFYWSGGLIKTSRELCIKANGMIFDDRELGQLSYSTILPSLRDGLSPDWKPNIHLGYHGCRHRKDYISNEEAEKNKAKIFNIQSISLKPIKKAA